MRPASTQTSTSNRNPDLFTRSKVGVFFFAVQVFVFILSRVDRSRAAANAPAASRLGAANSCRFNEVLRI